MTRWSDLSAWVGPTPNQGGAMTEYRGLVLHIQEGTQAGSLAWSKNPASEVSAHFYVAKDGSIAQLVDTGVVAWTQADGNGHWISVENEGYHTETLTPEQLEAVAQLYARGVQVYGWPLEATDSTSGRGLGWHGMGGDAWGGHPDCPGEPIKAQRPAILSRAEQILNGPTVEDGMQQYFIGQDSDGTFWLCDGMFARGPLERTKDNLAEPGQAGPLGRDEIADLKQLASEGMFSLWKGGEIRKGMVAAFGQRIPWAGTGMVPHTHPFSGTTGAAE